MQLTSYVSQDDKSSRDYFINTTFDNRDWLIMFWFDKEREAWADAQSAVYQDTPADGETPFEGESESVPEELYRAVQLHIDEVSGLLTNYNKPATI